jgi:hypothetical protein
MADASTAHPTPPTAHAAMAALPDYMLDTAQRGILFLDRQPFVRRVRLAKPQPTQAATVRNAKRKNHPSWTT